MKKQKFFLLALPLLFMCFASCLQEKDYTCECTYVPNVMADSNATTKTETFTVKGRILEQVRFQCQFDYEDKYFGQHYDGVCDIK